MIKYTDNTVEKNEHLDVSNYAKKIIPEIKQNLEEKWDKYISDPSFNKNLNQKNCKTIYANQETIKKTKSSSTKRKVLLAFMIIIDIGLIITTWCVVMICTNFSIGIKMSICIPATLVLIGLLIITIVAIKKKLKSLKAIITDLETKTNKLIKAEQKRIYPLISKYNVSIPLESFSLYKELVINTIFDDNFIKIFGLPNPNNVQYVDALNGYINKNPFVFYSFKSQNQYMQAYSKTVSYPYTERVSVTTTDANGHMHTTWRNETRFEAVTATTYKRNISYPISNPECVVNTFNLQKDTDFSFPSSKTIKTKEFKMENKEFNKLFDFNSNNELGFRTIWTALAQESLINLSKNDKYKFTYLKKGSYHYLSNDRNFNVSGLYDNSFIQGFDYEKIKELYINSFLELFECIYWTLAPFNCIPLFAHMVDQPKDIENLINYAIELETYLLKCNDTRLFNPSTNGIGFIHTITKLDKDSAIVNTKTHRVETGTEMVTAHGFHTGTHVIAVPYEEHFALEQKNVLNFNFDEKNATDPDKTWLNSGKIKRCRFSFDLKSKNATE